MIRVTTHTARKDGRTCSLCGMSIRSGNSYRQYVAVAESDIWNAGFVRMVAHEGCACSEEGWQIRNVEDHSDPDCEYVRKAYRLDIRKGSNVTVGGRQGVVVGATNHVVVRIKGDRPLHYVHPSDIVVVEAGV